MHATINELSYVNPSIIIIILSSAKSVALQGLVTLVGKKHLFLHSMILIYKKRGSWIRYLPILAFIISQLRSIGSIFFLIRNF